MARYEMQAYEPTKIKFELRIVMTLEEWQSVRLALKTDDLYGPAGRLKDSIDDMTEQAGKAFRAWPEIKAPDAQGG